MEQSGYEVDEAADGKEAIQKLGEGPFDLVVADIIMPERDGLEVIMFLKKAHPHIKIIAISAPSNEAYLKTAKALGASRLFAKPFELAELGKAVDELLS